MTILLCLSATYHKLFVKQVIEDGLKQVFLEDETICTQLVLAPSLQDAHHEFVFPQPPFQSVKRPIQSPWFEETEGELSMSFSDRVHMLPNPCMFCINEVLVAACSNDIIQQLSDVEIVSHEVC